MLGINFHISKFKKTVFLLFTLHFTLVTFFISPAFAQSDSGYDPYLKILSYETNINVTKTGTDVKEIISVDLLAPSHGIFRYLPQVYEYNSEDKTVHETSRLNIDFKSVKDLQGNNLKYSVSTDKQSILNKQDLFLGLFEDTKVVQIGDPEKTIEGKQVYVIEFTATNFPETPSTFLYGLNGVGWSNAINNFKAHIHFEQNPTDLKCKFGAFGEEPVTCDVKKLSSNDFVIEKDFIPYKSGIAITAKGLNFTHETADTNLFFQRYFYIAIPPILLILLFLYWYMTQRAPKGTGVITPLFTIPEFTPAEAGTIYDDSVDKVDVSATIIDLARRGLLKIKNVSAIDKKPVFELIKLESTEPLKDYETTLMNGIFSGKSSVMISSLAASSMAKTYQNVQNQIYMWGIKNGYFKSKPDKANTFTYAIIFGIITGAPAVIFGLLSMAVSIGVGVINFLFSLPLFYFRNYKTKSGVLVQEKIQGLKLFIDYAKKDQLEMLETPMTKQELFEKYLPYAMVFNLHESWAKVFKDLNISSPSWYESSSPNLFDTLYFVSYMNLFSNSLNTVFAIPSSQTGAGIVGGIVGDAIGGGFSGGGGGRW
jgi:hypothetical protein